MLAWMLEHVYSEVDLSRWPQEEGPCRGAGTGALGEDRERICVLLGALEPQATLPSDCRLRC